jgi:polyhydroxyalkanoate synthesis regulator phasin
LSNIGIKPESKTVDKGVIRTQKLIDELRREVEALKKRVTALGG